MEQNDLNNIVQNEELKEVAGGFNRIPFVPRLPATFVHWCETCGWRLETGQISGEELQARHDRETPMPGCKGQLRCLPKGDI